MEIYGLAGTFALERTCEVLPMTIGGCARSREVRKNSVYLLSH